MKTEDKFLTLSPGLTYCVDVDPLEVNLSIWLDEDVATALLMSHVETGCYWPISDWSSLDEFVTFAHEEAKRLATDEISSTERHLRWFSNCEEANGYLRQGAAIKARALALILKGGTEAETFVRLIKDGTEAERALDLAAALN